MNTAIRTNTAAWALGLILGLATTAQAQTPNPLEFTGTLNPAVGGWISPETNFGGITFDLIYDPTRPVVAGQWQFQVNGVAKDVFFQADMDYRTQDEYISTGIFATLDSPTFTFTGRADYSNPVYGGGGTAVMTGRNIRIEFASSRTGTFIDNPGQPDERRFPIVSYLRGLPLVAPTDYSGEWLIAAKLQYGATIQTPIAQLTLTPYTLGATAVVPTGTYPYAPVLPEAGARVYAVECESLSGSGELACQLIKDFAPGCDIYENDPNFNGCGTGEKPLLLWVNSDETGYMAQTSRGPTGTTAFYPSMVKPLQVFAETNQILVRSLMPGFLQTPTTIREGILFRVPAGLLQ